MTIEKATTMTRLERIRAALDDRYRRLVSCDERSVDHEVARLRDWINSKPELRAILTEAERLESLLDYETWRASLFDRHDYKWPARTEAGEVSLARISCRATHTRS